MRGLAKIVRGWLGFADRDLDRENAALVGQVAFLLDRMRQIEMSLSLNRSASVDVAAAHRIALDTLGGEAFDEALGIALERVLGRSAVTYQRMLRKDGRDAWRAGIAKARGVAA